MKILLQENFELILLYLQYSKIFLQILKKGYSKTLPVHKNMKIRIISYLKSNSCKTQICSIDIDTKKKISK